MNDIEACQWDLIFSLNLTGKLSILIRIVVKILSVGNKYFMRDVICDVINYRSFAAHA